MTSTRVLVLLVVAASLGCAGPSPRPEAERRIAKLERENEELRGQVEALCKQLEALVESLDAPISTICPVFPRVDAEVLDVKRDLKLVGFNKGKRDGVQVGYIFDVYLGATYKGQVRIQEVQGTTCFGLILHEVNPIARGDAATTSL
jgi:hypothetical protein